MGSLVRRLRSLTDAKHQVVMFSSMAIALYGYDQGMMSLINTNPNYLKTMGLTGKSPVVGVIVSVYYLGCTIGAVLASFYADKSGRKPSIFVCLTVTIFGNLIMFSSGLGWDNPPAALALMVIGRTVLGIGVGGIDAVVPIYSSELADDGARGKALAQEFQMNIFGLNVAFGLNLLATITLGKENEWAWRIPIIAMQAFPVVLLSVIRHLPETPRWFVHNDRKDDARNALEGLHGKDRADKKFDELLEVTKQEDGKKVGYADMLWPGGRQFHPTVITVMGQVNQALTGYGAVSVYGPQIFELLGFGVRKAEYLTMGNYVSYFFLMTFGWLLIDRLGRRALMVWGAFGLAASFALLTIFGALVTNSDRFNLPEQPFSITGIVILYIATGIFGTCWLSTVWLIPTEIYPSTARAQGSAISVVVWGIANFVVTLLTPIGFNNLKYWLFLVFAGTNLFAGWWTERYLPESGGRSFEENQEFFEEGEWRVKKVRDGQFLEMPREEGDRDEGIVGERERLLRRD